MNRLMAAALLLLGFAFNAKAGPLADRGVSGLDGAGSDIQQIREAPSRAVVWSKHDEFILATDQRSLKADPSWKVEFMGSRRQRVLGWDVGPPDAPPVLFWAGGPGEALTEEFFVSPPALHPEQYRWIAIEQPGAGDGVSEWIPGWRPEDAADDAATFLALRGVKARVIVAGWSWGSTMALLFAQRHPDLVRGVVAGGIWTNTQAEVRRYLGSDGARVLMPGVAQSFANLAPNADTACDLHTAIAQGQGGEALSAAYADAEVMQISLDSAPRIEPTKVSFTGQPVPVDMVTCKDALVRFAYIESEMMCRGERSEWSLPLSFPPDLGRVPLIVLQGKFDQICNPEVALRVFRAWPGESRTFVPANFGHIGPRGFSRAELDRAGIDPSQSEALRRVTKLHFGDTKALLAAAIACLD